MVDRTKRQRRYIARLKAQAQAGVTNAAASHARAELARKLAAAKAELAAAKARIAELEAGNAALKATQRPAAGGQDAPTRTGRRPLERPSELDKLKAENARLRALLNEDPDAAKLRKKVVELQAQARHMRGEMRFLAKERDKLRHYALPVSREARRLLTRQTHNVIVKALHTDRLRHVEPRELAEAERLVIALKPLFIEK
jgi:hypothetical protein